MALYFTSDLHLGHENALRYTNRPFSDLGTMNRVLIDNINDTVGMDDELYILGDVSFKISEAEAIEHLSKIKCRKIHLIKGNHDKGHNNSPIFASVRDYAEVKAEGRKLILMHYPLMSWNGSHRGFSIHLHGHIHSTGEYNQEQRAQGIQRYDVGVDANEYRPISLYEILDFFGHDYDSSE